MKHIKLKSFIYSINEGLRMQVYYNISKAITSSKPRIIILFDAVAIKEN